MDWRRKVSIIKAIHALPYGDEIDYLVLRHVTKSVPRLRAHPHHALRDAMRHHDALLKHRESLEGLSYLEVGPGWEFLPNIMLWTLGVERQFLVDRVRLSRPELVNYTIRHLQKMPFPGAVREPKTLLGGNFGEQLRKHYGIEYIAPGDARSLPQLADASIDLIGTTYCLEHIPADVLRAIVREFVRVSHKDTLVSMLVDYCDHNCHLDRGITAYNFLRFSEAEWRPYNIESRFQNRLRHSDYRKMFLEAGFAILDESADTPPDALEQIARTPLHEDFKKYEQGDLLTLIGHFVMRHPDRPEKVRAAA